MVFNKQGAQWAGMLRELIHLDLYVFHDKRRDEQRFA
jgi:hypothetical protein